MSAEQNNASAIISNVWSFATVLREDCEGYGDYLFLHNIGDFDSETFITPAYA